MFAGQLYGLHTLRQILESRGISSTSWRKAVKSLTFNDLRGLIRAALRHRLGSELRALGGKGESTRSRAELTVVFDDSVFRQWLLGELAQMEKKPEDERYYHKCYSGQTKTTVHGYKATVIGVCIGGTFHPYDLCLTAKGGSTKQAAGKMLEDLHGFLCRIASEPGMCLPKFHLSADSGFDSRELLDQCDRLSEKLPITPICVPKSSNKVILSGEEMTVGQAAAAFKDLEAKEKKDGVPYTIKCRGVLKKYGREVTLLFFRLNGSNKVSVIYTTEASIKEKTLRRRWFQRTQIEQFFRLLKDTLKIQQPKTVDKEGFERKLWQFTFFALIAWAFRNYCRTKFRLLKGWSFTRLKQRILHQAIEIEWFENIINDRDATFCTG